jgi:hypothetical protein
MKDHAARRFAACLIAVVAMLSCIPATAAEARQPLTAQANCVAEVTLTTEISYPDPFKEMTLDALVTAPDGRQFKVPAFWAGGNEWRFRYASGSIGTHTYRTECSDAANPRLHGVEGKLEVVPYRGENPLYRHGPIRVSKDRRHLEHADGTPFFWLGDTWWKGLSKRIPFEGFQKLTADRKAKGFTVVQIVAGPYPDEPPFDPRWANEGGMPYEKGYVQVNPAFFDYADRRIEHLIEAGIVPAIVGGWGWHMPSVGVEKMNRHWRYLIARYGAYPVVWVVGGEAGGPEWTAAARHVRNLDPYHRPATAHPYSSGRQSLTDDAVLDFDMLQTGHGGGWGHINIDHIVQSNQRKGVPATVQPLYQDARERGERQGIQRGPGHGLSEVQGARRGRAQDRQKRHSDLRRPGFHRRGAGSCAGAERPGGPVLRRLFQPGQGSAQETSRA